jgi:hypothetical protein
MEVFSLGKIQDGERGPTIRYTTPVSQAQAWIEPIAVLT